MQSKIKLIFSGFVVSAAFNCKEIEEFCLKKFQIKETPVLMIFKALQEKNVSVEERIKLASRIQIKSKLNLESLILELKNIFPSRIRNIYNIELPHVISDAYKSRKKVFVNSYDKDQKVKLKF